MRSYQVKAKISKGRLIIYEAMEVKVKGNPDAGFLMSLLQLMQKKRHCTEYYIFEVSIPAYILQA